MKIMSSTVRPRTASIDTRRPGLLVWAFAVTAPLSLALPPRGEDCVIIHGARSLHRHGRAMPVVSRKRALAAVAVIGGAVTAALAAYAAWRAPIAPPLAPGTAIVVSPHPDDETYAMGQTIAANVREGRRVIGVLCTDGEASQYATAWAQGPAGADVDGDGDRDRWDFGLARRGEYRDAMGALGVTELRFLGRAQSHGATGMPDRGVTAAAVAAALEGVAAPQGAVGYLAPAAYGGGGSLASLRGDSQQRPDHDAVHDGVVQVTRSDTDRAWFFGVYVYGSRASRRVAPRFVCGTDADVAAKRRAMDAYADLGALSTKEIFAGASADTREYLYETLP
ncbi:MAG: hypothetical protein FDZ70_01920 [Actinobacteria bacterium]|nr:MAG: hypothetical protein FDZ70_01920 [Actinomycetota bacterium]